MLLKKSQAGDTIVEVLVAITIVSLVLGGAFAATRAAQSTTQRNQERGLATKLLETQTERVRILAERPGSVIHGVVHDEKYCVKPDLTVVSVMVDKCPLEPGVENGIYDVSFIFVSPKSLGNFIVSVDFTDIGGEATQNVTTYYRVHKQQ